MINRSEYLKKKKSTIQAVKGKKRLKLTTILLRLAPQIIAYAKLTSYKMKKRNSHQLLLFPNSTTSNRKERMFQIVNQALVREYREQSWYWYGFYFQPQNIMIDNHLLTIIQQRKSLPKTFAGTKLGQIAFFGQKIGYDGKNTHELSSKLIFMGTNQGYMTVLQPKNKMFGFIQLVQEQNKLNAICAYDKYLLAFTQNTIFVTTLMMKNNALSFNLLFSQKISKISIKRAQFITHQTPNKQTQFYIFFINQQGLWRIILKYGFFDHIKNLQLLQKSPKFNPYTNMKIFYQNSLQRIIITVSCTKQITVLSHHLVQCKTVILYQFNNPTIPPQVPKVYLYSCIEYFNLQDNLLIGVSFTDRLYFIRIWPDYCQISKRAKFQDRILRILNIRNEGVLVVCQKILSDQEISQDKIRQGYQLKKITIILTRLSQILSFQNPVIMASVNRYDLQTNIQYHTKILTKYTINTSNLVVRMTMYQDKQIMIIGHNEIGRIGLNSWKQIYKKMSQTQNIQLLYFLILLVNQGSIFLGHPSQKQIIGLQQIFQTKQPIYKQILLQYYYQINQNPPIQFLSEIQNNNIELLLPFILYHKINNLTDYCQQALVQYYTKKDLRVVEELIISGVQYGWQIAVSQGWMRAQRKMVQMGMQIHFPLLKISSFIIRCQQQIKKYQSQLLQYNEQSQQNNSNVGQQTIIEENIQKFEIQLSNYSQQIIDYSLLALDNFLKPQQIQDIDDLKQFILALLRDNIFFCLITYQPKQTIKLLSAIFNDSQRINLIEKFDIEDFLHFSKMFKYLAPTHNVSISEIIYSHISQYFREITQHKPTPPNLRLQCRHLLFVQHAKLIKLKTSQFPDIPIKFVRNYLIDMLYSLSSNDNQDVKTIMRDQKLLLDRNKEEIDYYIEQFLVMIWQQAQRSPRSTEITQNSPKKSQGMLYDEIKEVFTTLQQINNSNSILLIKIMQSISQLDYCIKILKKYLQSTNIFIRSKLFDWIFDAIQNQAQRNILEVELMQHLSQLIQINKVKSRQLFDLIYVNKQRQIIERIDNAPFLQLQYLEMIINDTRDDQKQTIQQNFLNLHLKLLIKYQPERLIPVLQESIPQNIKYDLHEALKLSTQIAVYDQKNKIQTYLYEKVGEVQKCIRSYLKMLGQLFWGYAELYQTKHYGTNKQQVHQQQQYKKSRQYSFDRNKKSTHKLSLITQILTNQKYNISNTKLYQMQEQICEVFHQMEDLIFRQPIKKFQYLVLPLNIMTNLLSKIEDEQLYHCEYYKSILVFYFGNFISDAFEKGYIKYFIRWMQKSQNINLTIIKKHLIECYSRILKQQELLKSMANLEEGVLVKNITKNLITMENSVYSESICPICEKSLRQTQQKNIKGKKLQQDTLLFNCGHIFHKGCIQEDQNGEDYCWQCIYQNSIGAMVNNPEINLMDILKKYKQRKSFTSVSKITQNQIAQQKIISVEKKRIQRMGIFDKKISTLDNQIQILQMKLELSEYYDEMAGKIQFQSQPTMISI